MFTRFGLALFCVIILCTDVAHAVDDAARTNFPVSIRVVDQSGDVRSRPSSADFVPNFKGGGSVWLKREGAIEGPVVLDAHVGTGADGSAVVLFTLAPEAADRLAALTRANIGHRLAMVVNGRVVLNTLIAGEAPRTSLQFDGHFSAAEARTIAAEMTKARPAP